MTTSNSRYFCRFLIVSILMCLLAIGCQAEELKVEATSPNIGFLFTEGEQVDMWASVTGAKAPATVDYTVTETDGPWKSHGTVSITQLIDGVGERFLPLKLPGRGLYRLSLRAHSGGADAETSTWVAVTFAPPPPDPASHWGMFCIPWGRNGLPNAAEAMAASYRRLGVSWVRFNFWESIYGTVTISPDGKTAHADMERAKSMIDAIHRQHISVVANISVIPRILSSKPDASEAVGDAGALWGRVKPNDYGQWDSMIEQMARDLRGEVQYWEMWNEPDISNHYWSGTVEEFAEFIAHTSAAIKRGNPNARIVVCGFTPTGQIFAEKLLQLGVGKYIDIFSVHYTDRVPDVIDKWRVLLKKYHLEVPIWNTEDTSEVPINNMAKGIDHTIKFLHVCSAPAWEEYRPILHKDYTMTPAGMLYSVGVNCLGTAAYDGQSDQVPGWQIAFFQRGKERIAAIRNQSLAIGHNVRVTFAVVPLSNTTPTVTDSLGRSRPLAVINGRATLSFDFDLNVEDVWRAWFINGCQSIKVVNAVAQPGLPQVFEAETGTRCKEWHFEVGRYSSGELLRLHSNQEPDKDGYWIDIPLKVPKAGLYELIFSGSPLTGLASPRKVSPFTWRIDDGEEHVVDKAIPAMYKIIYNADCPNLLDNVQLSAGKHTFHLRLLNRRDEGDRYYQLGVDAIILRPVQKTHN